MQPEAGAYFWRQPRLNVPLRERHEIGFAAEFARRPVQHCGAGSIASRVTERAM